MNTIKGLIAEEAIDEAPCFVKWGADRNHIQKTDAEADDILGIVAKKTDAGETATIYAGPQLVKLPFDGTCTYNTEVALSATTPGRVQDVANAAASATIVGHFVDEYDADDGDAKYCWFYGVGSTGTK